MRALRILVAEDDAIIGLLLADVLDGMGHACTLAATEAETGEAAHREHPDLMIVDVQLGEGSGITAVRAITRGGAVPHLFVSGNAPRALLLRPGALVLQKPFREAELAQAMGRALRTPAPGWRN